MSTAREGGRSCSFDFQTWLATGNKNRIGTAAYKRLAASTLAKTAKSVLTPSRLALPYRYELDVSYIDSNHNNQVYALCH